MKRGGGGRMKQECWVQIGRGQLNRAYGGSVRWQLGKGSGGEGGRVRGGRTGKGRRKEEGSLTGRSRAGAVRESESGKWWRKRYSKTAEGQAEQELVVGMDKAV